MVLMAKNCDFLFEVESIAQCHKIPSLLRIFQR
jgi:hypothetical protein